MDHLEALRRKLQQRIFILAIVENILLVGLVTAGFYLTSLNYLVIAGIGLAASIILCVIVVSMGSNFAMQPIAAIWQTILRISPTDHGVPAPDLNKVHFGRELVASLTAQLNELVNVAQKTEVETKRRVSDLSENFVAQNLPLPLFIIDNTDTIRFANAAAEQYIGITAEDMRGKNVYMVLDMSFPSENTFDKWLKAVKSKNATAVQSWERVRLNIRDNHPVRLFDLAAYYNRDNPDHLETMIAIFDHTKQYSQDDQAVSFIALTVHELRTPLTLLRGYIEVFEDEIGHEISPELQGFMEKMRAQAEQLMSFVNNILNVARVDDDQLELHLEEENWPELLKSTLAALNLQAKVRGISLESHFAEGLPTVGVDRLSIQEVINNLIDNAIKYSGNSKVIKVDTHLTQDGFVETTVEDFGLGISASIMPHLFTKFYRDHRNRAQIGGTGLGLYLSKAIVAAHGGNIWVRSKEGQGSTFGFTLVPYAQLAEEKKRTGDKEIARSAHGWIKNHSLYRR
ncbi:MAG TPA: ATP-binding protein [Candidatus Saccharimonadales bacterium]|nr:ATP-binding protein [Candidatus Saccharimonadales bacterium]